jgi:hypothetical protein
LLDQILNTSYIRSSILSDVSITASTFRPFPLPGLSMTHVRTGKARPFARSAPSGAFDQYLLDIQTLPMIYDPDEEKRLARRAAAGDE